MSELKLMDEPYEELIGGQWVAMSPRPFMAHIFISGNIFGIFRDFLRGKHCRAISEVNVFLDDENLFIPDVCIVCDRSKIRRDGVHGAPDLVVEVLSKSTQKKDRFEKKDVYEKYGVKEYWLVNPEQMTIEVHCMVSGKFVLSDVYVYYAEGDLLARGHKFKDKFSVSFMPDLEIKLSDVFDDLI